MSTDQTRESAGDGSNGLELFLLALRYREGRLQTLEGNTPLLLDDPAAVWIVYNGTVDLFTVRLRDGEVASPRRHLLRAEAGGIVFGLRGADSSDVTLLATGVPGTRVLKMRLTRLQTLAADIEYQATIALLIERWVGGLSDALVRDLPPKSALPLSDGQTFELKAGETAGPLAGVVWALPLTGKLVYTSRDDISAVGDDLFVPVSAHTWLRADEPCTLRVASTTTVFARDPAWTSIAAFHALAYQLIIRNDEHDTRAEQERLQKKADIQGQVLDNAFTQIATLLEPQITPALAAFPGAEADALLASFQLVGDALGIAITPPQTTEGRNQHSAIRLIARASGVRLRQVALKGEWWRQENGPLLASIEALNQPVALLPTAANSYLLHDTVARTSAPLTAQLSASLAPVAYTMYRPFPQRALSAKDLLLFGLRGTSRELMMIVLMGVAVGLLGLVGPVITGFLFDRVIPETQHGQLLGIGVVLLVVALATALFQIVRSIAVLRLESKIDSAVQAAVWDRLLNLPVPFFRNYTAGDLGVRAMGINAIRQALSGPVVSAILSGVFSLFTLGLLFSYDSGLAMIAFALVLVAVSFTTLIGYLQVRHQRATTAIAGRIAGTVLQFINGIAKFRVAGAEHRAFATWAEQFTEQRRLTYRARTIGNGLAVFNAAYPIITALAIYATVAASLQRGLSSGQFLAFNAAFTQFLFAALQLSSALSSVLSIIPLYERARPILQTLPEVTISKADPGELAGEIEISHVSFRYKEQSPLVLKDISLHIHPGEFVALVGPSGSGKSSLLRLLMGFETPESGAIYYDGQDLTGLDLGGVRQQTGVVLQNGSLMAGTLLQNIIGSSLLTLDDAWEAAHSAGFDEDIKQMPMGMFTVVSEGAGTLSGGQRQRLLIARAIAHKPRILFFDEATSALDNRTQNNVSRSLEALHATRIVIAHRLSTIINAHRIYVLDGGRIVQAGTYSELVAQPGLFADLAKRQIA